MPIHRSIDHLVYTVPDLAAAIKDLHQRLGVLPVFGGYHVTQGTKNALLNLGNGCYLEILAADGDHSGVVPPRWMGVDLIKKPQITRWAIKSTDLPHAAAVLKNYQSAMGTIQGGERQTKNGELLKWNMIMPLAKPAVEIIPFAVDWQQSAAHPTDGLADRCRLIHLEFTHPQPAEITPVLDRLQLSANLAAAAKITIAATIESPNGIVVI